MTWTDSAEWLESSEFNNYTANVLLNKNKMIQLLFEGGERRETAYEKKFSLKK
jgi:hypothetical protein